jgi:hypothetical protein
MYNVVNLGLAKAFARAAFAALSSSILCNAQPFLMPTVSEALGVVE